MRAKKHLVALGCLVLSQQAALAAPAGLMNKTITLQWTNSYLQRAPDGKEMGRQITVTRTIYVSTQGRLFERAGRQSDGGKRARGDLDPGATQIKSGEARGLRFAGDKLVGNLAFASGATQYVVSFGSGYTSCSLQVSLGKAGGNMRMKGLDGRIYEVLSSSTSGQSCAISEGNALAN